MQAVYRAETSNTFAYLIANASLLTLGALLVVTANIATCVRISDAWERSHYAADPAGALDNSSPLEKLITR